MALLRNLHAIEIPLLAAAWVSLFVALPVAARAAVRGLRVR